MGGDIDVMKLRSSLELFLKVTSADDFIFRAQLADLLTTLT